MTLRTLGKAVGIADAMRNARTDILWRRLTWGTPMPPIVSWAFRSVLPISSSRWAVRFEFDDALKSKIHA